MHDMGPLSPFRREGFGLSDFTVKKVRLESCGQLSLVTSCKVSLELWLWIGALGSALSPTMLSDGEAVKECVPALAHIWAARLSTDGYFRTMRLQS